MEAVLTLTLMITGLMHGRFLNFRNILCFAGLIAALTATVMLCGSFAAGCFFVGLLF